METRIIIPDCLKVVASSFGRLDSDKRTSDKLGNSAADDEKPSSSSGHFEASDQDENQGSLSPFNYSSSDESKSNECNKTTSSNSSSTSSPDSSDNEDSSLQRQKLSTKRDKPVPKFDHGIGSSQNILTNKKFRKRKNSGLTTVKICASQIIEKGTVLNANDGDVRIFHFKGIPVIAKDDIRFLFGCFEKLTTSDLNLPTTDELISSASTLLTNKSNHGDTEKSSCNSKLIRLCNWVRFLRRSNVVKLNSESDDENGLEDGSKRTYSTYRSSTSDNFNIDSPNNLNTLQQGFLVTVVDHKSNNVIARYTNGRPIFEVTSRLVPGTELVVYFDMDSITQSSSFVMPLPLSIGSCNSFSPPPHFHQQQQPLSTLISSSSTSFGLGSNNGFVVSDCDEKGQLQQQQRLLSLYPNAFRRYDDKSRENAFRVLTNSSSPGGLSGMLAMLDHGKKIGYGASLAGVRKEENKMTSLTDAPLDLSKLPNVSHSTEKYDPFKVGTPFDSPDSNEDDCKITTNSTRKTNDGNNGNSAMFSIRNVLKQPCPPSKLFQPYSLEFEKGLMRKGNQLSHSPPATNSGNASICLATPPSISSSSHSSPMVIRSPPVLRPILRTRGRERSLLPCEVCGKAFDRPSLLKRHLRTHTGEKPHICDVCSKGFSTSSSLNTHRRIHSGEKPHQCPICGKRFTASSNLYYHRMTHNKEKPHKCMLCGKSFPTPGDLKSHQYVHSGSWPYTCPVCHRGFSKQTNLRNHLLLHSGMGNNGSKPGDKPHTCQICDKKFALACNLRAHIRTHEEDPVSRCSICKRTFLTSLNMLVNGSCRSCLINMPTNASMCLNRDTSPTSDLTSGESVKPMESSLLSHRISTSLPNQHSHSSSNSMPISSLNIPQIPGFSLPLPGPLSLTGGLHFPTNPPTSSASSVAAAAAAASLFRNGGAANALASSTPNPFFEQLFEWNYRFAKETAGNLSLNIVQQKLLESQVFAAQLMSVSANNPGFGALSEILRLRPTEFPQMDVSGESKFLPR